MKADRLRAVVRARDDKRQIARVADIGSGEEAILLDGAAEGDLVFDDALRTKVEDAIAREQSRLIELDGRRLFVQVLTPPLRLAIVGAGHISQHLSVIAAQVGFDVTVIDPRTTYASAERFPGATLSNDWPDDALAALAPDRRTAIVTLSHDPKLDEPALAAALRSDAFYIGALGSRRTQVSRRARMAEQGFDDESLDRIHGPVGFDIGALSPAEIAVAIVAEMIDVLRPKKKGLSRS